MIPSVGRPLLHPSPWRLTTPTDVEGQVEVVAPSRSGIQSSQLTISKPVLAVTQLTNNETSVEPPLYPTLTPRSNPELTARTEIRKRKRTTSLEPRLDKVSGNGSGPKLLSIKIMSIN